MFAAFLNTQQCVTCHMPQHDERLSVSCEIDNLQHCFAGRWLTRANRLDKRLVGNAWQMGAKQLT